MEHLWTHNICEVCWQKRNPNTDPVKMKFRLTQPDKCCFCGNNTYAGIYLRFDPASPLLKCTNKN